MPRHRHSPRSYAELENRLVLVAWLNWQFGHETNKSLLKDAKHAEEGFDAEGRSFLGVRLLTREQCKIESADLFRYDDNIRKHLAAMNSGRNEPIALRYFQHLAALYTEFYLDWFFRSPQALLDALNDFAIMHSTANRGVPDDNRFARDDLRKLAFWMATGSGKTLIMHLNYRQFLHYNTVALDNILLITPNEGLSDQHMAELAISGIPGKRFNLADGGLIHIPNTVRIIEITKLVEQKRGGGVSVPVEAFEGNNLIFVDEGHKGTGGDVWRGYRDAIGSTGFTFEYSATFGQALTAARNSDLIAEYSKSIAFDYSYRYFHGDGFGKDFNILNLHDAGTKVGAADSTDMLLLGSLLTFYEQKRVFADHGEAFRPYNLESPLWVFVGGSVNAVYSRNRCKQSDVLTVVRFLHRVLRNDGGWTVDTIDRILDRRSGLRRPDGTDVFDGKFGYLDGLAGSDIYNEILSRVMHTERSDTLQLGVVKNARGEIGMKASASRQYFGVIYIGDASKFRALVAEQSPEIAVQDEALATSLFESVARPDTTIEVLVGARKFMEGWNSWRVANMGLLNVGRNEGAQIIQLFGRGVRLRGKNTNLKRSAKQPGPHPAYIGLLETLNIFAVRADYMVQFRTYLELEDISPEGSVELPLAVRPNAEFLDRQLLVPRLPENREFADEDDVVLAPLAGVRSHLDASLKVSTFDSGHWNASGQTARTGHVQSIPASSLDLVDWKAVHLALLYYAASRAYPNLAIAPATSRLILESSGSYELVADDSLVSPRSPKDLERLTEAIVAILKKYLDKLYRTQQERWEGKNLRYIEVGEHDLNFQDYVVTVPMEQDGLLSTVRKLIEQADRIYDGKMEELPHIHFDRHLYQPLLVEQGTSVKTNPPQLNDGERRFVADLREFCEQEQDGVLANQELFLLRNLGRSKGVGFFHARGFYPDFILWLKTSEKQRIIFVEPHGMLNAPSYVYDEKAQLHKELLKLSIALAHTRPQQNPILDSYIVSVTPFETLRGRYDDGSWDRERFTASHILFPERTSNYDYIQCIVS